MRIFRARFVILQLSIAGLLITTCIVNADKTQKSDGKLSPKQVKEIAARLSDNVTLGAADLTQGIPGEGPLSLSEIQAWLDREDVHNPLTVKLPMGLNVGKIPEGVLESNPLTRAKIELGRQLYFDTRLSKDNTISCASCHDPKAGYAAPTQFGVGIEGLTGNRNSPTAYNRILSTSQFWDGRAASLEEQAIGPIANPIEMGNTHDAAVKAIAKVPGYKLQFEQIFDDHEVNIDNVGKAIAAFERVLVTGPAPFDYYEKLKPYLKFESEDFEDDPDLKDEYDAIMAELEVHPMSESAIRGRNLFFSERVNCAACHVGANLADEKYHNLGVGMDQEKPDLGRYEVTGDEKDKGAFKTPTIRNVALTGPYMHDGSQKTLLDVVEHYAKGGIPNPYLSDKIKKIDLNNQEKKDLVAFMEACTGELPVVEQGRLPE
ncbi:cytochrome-c peroxidase [Rubinisphaera italica]|uniref:Cytochrome c551 peroxidase n=1 Tax=Rubinisphaera italica TaxID=2527969 RepID=A0A5C5XGC1_9PLAN|nr:cytochrome c peroxidase [Rubinisphaera italica]TWT61798.1 Cytochrome c551 peroxidase precursor [Rubinisphaera italica]